MKRRETVNLKELALKCRSKKEVYNVLLFDWDVYLPPIQSANSSYIRGVVRGTVNVSNEAQYYHTLACECKNS